MAPRGAAQAAADEIQSAKEKGLESRMSLLLVSVFTLPDGGTDELRVVEGDRLGARGLIHWLVPLTNGEVPPLPTMVALSAAPWSSVHCFANTSNPTSPA